MEKQFNCPKASGDEIITIDQLYKETTIKALDRAGGSVKGAAKLMGIHERTVWRWIKMYGLERPAPPPPRIYTPEQLSRRDAHGRFCKTT